MTTKTKLTKGSLRLRVGCSSGTQRRGRSLKQKSCECTKKGDGGNGLKAELLEKSPLGWARQVLGFVPDQAQASVLRGAAGVKRIVLNCTRQWGKSTVAAVLVAHRLVTVAGSTVLVVGPAGKQAGETVKKVCSFLAAMGIATRGDGVNPGAKMLPNGSRIVPLPGREGTTRGFSAVSMLIVEEAARVPDEVYLALLPSLAVCDGDVMLLSTPKGRRGFFYREAMEGVGAADTLVHTGPVTECSRISEKYLARQRARGDVYFRQEFLCEFVETGKFLLDEATVNAMENPEERAWDHV